MQNLVQAQVFTPPWATNEMLDLLGEEKLAAHETFFFEPTCGDGQMLLVMVERIFKALLRKYQDHEKAFCETLFKFYASELDEVLVPKARMRIFAWAVENAGRPLSRIEEGLICLQLAQSIECRDALKDSIPNIDPAPSMRALKRKVKKGGEMSEFKIMKGTYPCTVLSVPMEYALKFDRQAYANHNQTIQRLNERGGLTAWEFYMTAHGMELFSGFRKVTEKEAVEWLESEFGLLKDIAKLKQENLDAVKVIESVAMYGRINHTNPKDYRELCQDYLKKYYPNSREIAQ